MGAFTQAGKQVGSTRESSTPDWPLNRHLWWNKYTAQPNPLPGEAPKAPEPREGGGMGVLSAGVPYTEQVAYIKAANDFHSKQQAARKHYTSLWETNPSKFVTTMRDDLESGKITQAYYDWQFQDKDKQKFRTQVESQAAAKAAQEKKLAQQREVAKQAELAAQRSAQQQRTLQNLEAEQEGESATVVSRGGSAPMGAAGGRRRRGARLSVVLGI